MRKKFTALIGIHLVAVVLVVYPYALMATSEAPEPSQNSTYSTASILPTPTPEANATESYPMVTVSFNHWDPHDSPTPTLIEIVSPRNNHSLPEGYVYLMVGVSSSKWLINGVFCTADWFSGPQPIWFYNLRSAETVLYAMVTFTGVPAGNHTVSVYANLHDGTFLTSSVSFRLESTKSGEQ